MASEGEACCESDPNFAVICAFLEKFGPTCGISNVDFLLLQEMLENTHEVSTELIDLHIKLLRKARKSVSSERWERAIIKICHTFCSQDAWEMERFGYRKARLSAKIRILKELLEMQFDYNPKFKTEINKMTADELRSQPIGRDKMGNAYWLQCDENCQLRVYKEDPDEETWTLVAKDRDGLVSLISQLNSGDTVKLDLEPVVNEDSNSTEVEKPIVDTGQVLDSDSKKEETDSSNDVEVKNGDDVVVKKDDSSNEEKGEEESETKEDDQTAKVDESVPVETINETSHNTAAEENFEEDGSESALNLSQKKPLLRIKSITELMSQPAQEKNQTVAASPMKMQMYSAPIVHRTAEHEPDSGFKRYMPGTFAENLKKRRLIDGCDDDEEEDDDDDEEDEDEEGVGEAIEEPVMYVYGEGNGKDCQTGNEKVNSNSDCDKNDSSQGALNDNKSDVENSINSSKGDSSLSVSEKCGEHSTSQNRFKLGTIIDVKSDGNAFAKSPSKKSRWDVGKPAEDGAEVPVAAENSVKKPMFFFGPGCLQFKPSVQNETSSEQLTADEPALKESENGETTVALSGINSTENENEEATDETDDVKVAPCNVSIVEALEISDPKLASSHKQDSESEEIVNTPSTTVVQKDEPPVETCEVLQEIKEQIVDVKETTENVLPPCVEVSLPSDNKNEEVKEEPVVKKLAYECGSGDCDKEVKIEQKKEEPIENKITYQCGFEKYVEEAKNKQEEDDGDVGQKVNESVAAEVVDGENCKENTGLSTEKSEECATANVVNTKLNDLQNKDVTTSVVCNAVVNTAQEIESKLVSEDVVANDVCLRKTDKNISQKRDNSGKSLANIIDKMCNAKTASLVQTTEASINESHEETPLDTIGVKDECVNASCDEVKDDEVTTASSEPLTVGESETLTKETEITNESSESETAKSNLQEENPKTEPETKTDDISSCVEKRVCHKKEDDSLGNQICLEKSDQVKEASNSEIAVVTERRVTRASKNKPIAPVEPRKKVAKNKKTVAAKKPDAVEDSPAKVPSSNSVEATTKTAAHVDVEDEIEQNIILTNDDGDGNKSTSNKDEEASAKPITLTSFTFDFDGEAPPPLPIQIPKLTRKRSRLSTESKPEEEVAEKRQKLRGKRTMDPELRRSIESQKSNAVSSSEEDSGAPCVEEEEDEPKTEKVFKRGKGKRRKKWFAKKSRLSPVPSSDVTSETSRADSVSTPPTKKAGGPRKRKTTLLGLELPADSDVLHEPITGVRQSRRIAQLKIREEAERRKIEESVLNEIKSDHKKKKSKKSEDKDYKADTRRKGNQISDDESTADAVTDEKKKKRKRKHKDFRKLFDGTNPWLERSDSSSSNEVEEEEEEDIIEYTEEEPKSDHEFSPESDLEDAGDVQPLKRARTAKKESDVDEVDDCACEKCGKKDHPEWILLCDGCDNGWHCSCLRPALLVIPEGDWFCPPCQHVKLIQNLQVRLKDYDRRLSKKNIEDRRKERLAYVGISLNNVLPAKETEANRTKRPQKEQSESEDDEEESESESSESESSSGSDDEPIYRLRERRQAHSYRFNDYDELINSAIQDEMEAVKGAGNQGRGKDISTIVNAEKEEEAKTKLDEEVEPLPPVVPKEVEVTAAAHDEAAAAAEEEEPEEEIVPVKKIIGRKKPRKLNSLDISSGDDHYSDEDFKGTTSTDDEDEEDLDDVVTDSSEGAYGRRNGPVRRSTRARIARYDREFIDDDSDEDDAPRRKKTRSIWDESESEESDRSWGGRNRRKKTRGARTRKPSVKRKRSKKKKKRNDDSDSDAFKRKRKPKVKYGRIGSDNEDLGIRTRGKKINYLDVLGSDSDDDVPKRSAPKIVESEEEYVVNEEDVLELENNRDSSEEDETPDEEGDVKAVAAAAAAKENETNTAVDKLLEKTQLNPIEEINKNIEEMSETDMEKLMEEESYANKQLALVALQIEKEKRRKEQEARNLEVLLQHSQKTTATKKRGRNDPADLGVDLMMDDYQNNEELSEPPGVALPIFADIPPLSTSPEEAPKKRKGRGKGKKTLAAEAAKQAVDVASPSTGPPPLTAAAKLSVAAPPQPFAQSQPAPSVITRMLQSQPFPVSTSAAYYPGDPQHPDMVQAGGGQYIQGAGRVPVGSPYRSAPPPPPSSQQPVNVAQYQMRPGAPPQQQPLRNPSQGHPPPHIYQHPHRSAMDPSPSGGGPITIPQDRNSPALIPPPADSPLSNKSESTPPPPPYNRSSMLRYPPGSNGAQSGGGIPPPGRHVQMIPGHVAASRPNSMSPYPPHPSIPPNYYGSYGPPPPLVAGEEALPPPAAYQTPPYPDHYGTDGPSLAISENGSSRGYDDETGGGEFGGLVSYFSSQREDDLDT